MEMPMTSRSSTITRRTCMKKRKMPAIHPGEVLMEEFLKPMNIT